MVRSASFPAGHLRRPTVLMSVLLALCLPPAAHGRQDVVTQPFGPAVPGTLALGVAPDGAALLAWSGPGALQTSVRAPGGPFRTRQGIGGPGPVARAFGLAVGSGGDGAIAWRRADGQDRPTGSLLVSVRRPGRNAGFAAPVAVPHSTGDRGRPAVAIGPSGRTVVAWTAPGPRGCGSVVRAAILVPGRAPGTTQRLSPACAHAGPVQAVMSDDGTGVVVWRGGATAASRRVEVVPVGRTRFGALRHLGTGPVGADIAVAPTRRGALVLWRQTTDATTSPVTTQLQTSDVTTAGSSPAAPVAPAGPVVGVPRVDARRDGSAVITWEEGTPATWVLAATRAPYPTMTFGVPEPVDPCGAADASRTSATPAMAADGSAAVIFQSACMGRFSLGADYGVALVRRPADGDWLPPQALSDGGYSTDARIGAGDTGELVVAWLESGPDGGVRVRVIPR